VPSDERESACSVPPARSGVAAGESIEVSCSLIDWTSPFLLDPHLRVVLKREVRREERRPPVQ